MKAKKNTFKKLLSLITYKEPTKTQEFYIPEVKENAPEPELQTSQTDNKGVKKSRDTKALVKPTPVSQAKNRREKFQQTSSQHLISNNMENNIAFIEQQFNYPANKDIFIRKFTIAKKHKAFITYIEGMVNRTIINNFILRPLFDNSNFLEIEENCPFEHILESIIEIDKVKKVTIPGDVISEILTGNTCLFVEGCNYYISCETKGFEKRSVEKPQLEGVVKGSQEGFTENLQTNITLVRRIIKNKNLTTEFLPIGNQNHNQCAVLYIKGIVNPAIVNEVKRRISSVSTDFILGSGMMEQFIEDHPMSILPNVLSTERPDRTASHILEGRVAVIAEGTPFALVVPITLPSLMHTPEDTSLRWQYGTLLRFIRIFAIFVATLLPGLYVALTNFHREMIPTDLLIAIAQARENVPFPTIIEVLLMEISFELIREAGIRVPGIIGNTIGIIGALILGQAAVQANLVSPVLIIIIAFTGLGNFAIPDFNLAFGSRILRILFIFLGAALGFYGISLGIVGSMAVLLNMKSFGVPMFSGLSPKIRRSNDLILSMPIWKRELRPDSTNSLNVRRQPEISRRWINEDANVPGSQDYKEGVDE